MSSIPTMNSDLLERISLEFQTITPLIPTYIHLLVSAIFPIYTSAHASLARPKSAASSEKKSSKDGEEDEEDTDEESPPKIEALTPSDAILFPVMAGCTLAGLYFILKIMKDPAWLNWVLGIYFAFIGFFFATKFIKDALSVVRSVILPTQYSLGGKVWKASSRDHLFKVDGVSEVKGGRKSPLPGFISYLPLPQSLSKLVWSVHELVYQKARLEIRLHKILHVKSSVDVLDFFSIVLSAIIVIYHTFIDKPWFLTNLLGFSFCYGSLQFMTPGTSWTGTLLLCALFLYDIYFVFYTPMMVTVATKLDVPIKLLFPRPDGCIMPVGAPEDSPAMEEYLQCLAKKRTMAMLGLGDIVIPGMMLAFALRFDLYLYYLRMVKPESKSTAQKEGEKDIQKPTYQSATGSWGERFWTSKSLRNNKLQAKQFPKPYFYATVTGYIIGMIVTVVVMQVFQHAQPALLYLVPGVLISLWGTALFKGDIKTLWKYSEVPEDDNKSKNDNKQENAVLENGSITEKADTDTTTNGSLRGDESANTSDQKNTSNATNEDLTDKSEKNDEHDVKSSKQQDSSPPHLVYFAIDLPTPRSKVQTTQEEKSRTIDP